MNTDVGTPRTCIVCLLGVLATLMACGTQEQPDALNSDELRAEAPDATGVGPNEVVSREYKFPAVVDPNVLAGVPTELWAQVYRPKTLTASSPVAIFLHGNHGTCGTGSNPRSDSSVTYTSTGKCPAGYVVTPNHLGYGYAAERLASWGYVVVSINANRGITGGAGVAGDSGLVLARGRLILAHLTKLAAWNAGTEATPTTLGVSLKDKLDLGQVGMMGHSRGGEGVRAALDLYSEIGSVWPARIRTPIGFKGIFEIGPVDGQSSRVLDARNVAWSVLLPTCDGDVSDLQGMNPFERMSFGAPESTPRPKSLFAVLGANHNYYNTEWQTSDSGGCPTGVKALFTPNGGVGSGVQRTTGLHGLLSFFRGYVGAGANPVATRMFDPQFSVPPSLSALTPVERTYLDGTAGSTTRSLETFRPAGVGAAPKVGGTGGLNMSLNDSLSSGLRAVSIDMGNGRKIPGAVLKWAAGSTPTMEIAISGALGDFRDMNQLMLRLATLGAKTGAPTVQLKDATGALSPMVSSAEFTDFGLWRFAGHVILDGVRMPLSGFTGVNLGTIRSVILRFNGANAGLVAAADLRLSKQPTAGIGSRLAPGTPAPAGLPTPPPPAPIVTGNRVAAVRAVGDRVEVDLESEATFPVANELAYLQGGDEVLSDLSSYAGSLDTHMLRFSLAKSTYATLTASTELVVSYGTGSSTQRWNIGRLGQVAALPISK